MEYRMILAGVALITMVTCKNQTANQTDPQPKETMATNTPNSSPAKAEPEMAPGLPPDQEAVKQAEKETKDAAANQQGVVYLSEGESKFLQQYQMNVSFRGITEDSRCPAGVDCIWEGVASAEVEVMGTATRPMVLKLSTMQDANKGYEKAQSFNGYSITLISVTPGTTSSKGFEQLRGKYKIGLKFSRSSAQNPTTK